MMTAFPLDLDDGAPFACSAGAMVATSAFRKRMRALAARLSAAREAVNNCEDRFNFLVGFAAALTRGTTTLLPSSHGPSAVIDLQAEYPACELLDDERVAAGGPSDSPASAPPAADFVAAIGHTSGSTGRPTAHAKTWAALHATTRLNAAAIRAASAATSNASQPWIVATVPAQHMYGLETSALLPLLAGFGIHCGRPLLPADVAAALVQVPEPRVLVTTPVHLRVLIDSNAGFPEVAVILSATAPLQQDLARMAERRFGAALIEMFGSTETCVIATRRTASQASWRPYAGVELEASATGTLVRAPWLSRPQALHDAFALNDDGSFSLIGRQTDFIEIAGKRASLADLTRRLAGQPGVRDAYVFRPEAAAGARVPRCAALVVAPGLAAQDILRGLRRELDPAFLPRPLVVVANLPRNRVGKLTLEQAQCVLSDALAERRRRPAGRSPTGASPPHRET